VFLASVLFCLALNFKQMALYYAPAFFLYLLRWSYLAPTLRGKAARLATCASAVLLAFAACWAPLLAHGPDVAVQALRRVFPVGRGLFEDKVANFWCTVNPVLKPRERLTALALVGLAAALTLVGLAPSAWVLWRGRTRAGDTDWFGDLRWLLFASSSSFFLFSYHVHEKSVLLPCVAALLLLDELPLAMTAYQVLAVYSMAPLLHKDGVLPSTMCATGMFGVWIAFNHERRLREAVDAAPHLLWGLALTMLVPGVVLSLLVATETRSPLPGKWPDLWVVVLEAHAFVGLLAFHAFACVTHYRRAWAAGFGANAVLHEHRD